MSSDCRISKGCKYRWSSFGEIETRSDDDDDDDYDGSDDAAAVTKGNEKVEKKKLKQNKAKKPKVTIAEAADKIDTLQVTSNLCSTISH